MADKYYDEAQVQDIIADISNKCRMPVLGAGGGFAPIGTRAYFDGTFAPQGWLICDGSTHNIADYPELSAYFASHHGSSNYYGGDGTTTFATPVMNGMPNGGVDTPDEHIVGEWRETQDGVLKFKPVYKKVLTYNSKKTSIDISSLNIDTVVNSEGFYDSGSDVFPIDRTATNFNFQSGKWINGKSSINLFYGSSVGTVNQLRITLFYTKTTDTYQTVQEGHSSDGNGVFCVKATVSGDANAHQYSTDEQIVGMDENGNTVYERTFIGTADTQDGYYIVSDATLRNIVMISGKVKHKTIPSYEYTMPYMYMMSPSTEYAYLLINEGTGVQLYSKGDSYGGQYRVVLQYTKTQS